MKTRGYLLVARGSDYLWSSKIFDTEEQARAAAVEVMRDISHHYRKIDIFRLEPHRECHGVEVVTTRVYKWGAPCGT
jgi:hypothetical protein